MTLEKENLPVVIQLFWSKLCVDSSCCFYRSLYGETVFKRRISKEKCDFNVKKKTPFGSLGLKSTVSKKLSVLLCPGSSSYVGLDCVTLKAVSLVLVSP